MNLLYGLCIGLLPVLCFLGALLYGDSFKLVRPAQVLAIVLGGGAIAGVAYLVNSQLLGLIIDDRLQYARWLAPLIEESLKAALLFLLFSRHRIAFLVDAVILGFAIGAGFSLVENLYYLYTIDNAQPLVWVVRGFGTAIMHGGATATAALITQSLRETEVARLPTALAPGILLGTLLHMLFNQLLFAPLVATATIALLVPVIMLVTYRRSTASVHRWLELDFDADAELIRQLDSRDFSATPVGLYLRNLQAHFEPLVMVDLLCYLRIYTELSMRAKALILMRQHGIELPSDDTLDGHFQELRYLRESIGKTGELAIDPLLSFDSRDLWHLNSLEQHTNKHRVDAS